jgi:site-specific DNA recombinase
MNKTKFENNEAWVISRVSHHSQKTGVSFEAQESAAKKHADLHGLKIVEFKRLVESAKATGGRTKFHELLKLARRLGIKHIIFYQFDRETRNLTDNEANELLVKDGKFTIHYSRDNKVFNTETSDSDFFLRDIHAVTNRQFIRNLSAKVSDAMTKKAEMGWFPANHVPLGYIHQHTKDAAGKTSRRGTIIIPDPDTRMVKLVQREFELRAQNFSLDAICDQVQREGLVPKEKFKAYSRSAIEKRLKSPFYRGSFIWKNNVYKGNHELIIQPEIIDAVDATFGLKPTYGRGLNAFNAVFSGGWMRCGLCGCQIVFDPKTKRSKTTDKITVYNYYHCSNGKKEHDKQINISEDKLWKQFERAIEAINIPESLAKKIAEVLNETFEATSAATKKLMSACREEMELLQTKQDTLFDMYSSGEIDGEEYQRQVKRLKEFRTQSLEKLEHYQQIISGVQLETARSTIELATMAKSLWKRRSPIERRQMLDLLLSNRTLDGVNVRYDLKKPFAVLAEMARKQDWRSQGDSNPCILREREVS